MLIPDIHDNVAKYLGYRESTARYASFDYCFNHFQLYHENGREHEIAIGTNMQLSCLHLGFYLASWGMLRGSSALLHHSVKIYKPVIEVIANCNVWDIDADNYFGEACTRLIDAALQLRRALPGRASDILVTKIMLGVFGCVPAFDNNFKRGFGACALNRKTLGKIAKFHDDNAETIEQYRKPTIDFDTGKETRRRYTRAKVIDMIFFIEGIL